MAAAFEATVAPIEDACVETSLSVFFALPQMDLFGAVMGGCSSGTARELRVGSSVNGTLGCGLSSRSSSCGSNSYQPLQAW